MHHLSERLQKYFPANKIQWIESAEPDKWWEAYQAADHTDGTIIVFRDIYRSKVHAAAWEKLAKQAEVQLSIDLFRYGLLFFRHQLQEKQHFVLKYRE